MSIDALTIAKKLEAAGMPRQQGEALAEALRDEIDKQLVTKPDLDAAIDKINGLANQREARTNARIDQVEQRPNTRFDRLESRMEGMLLRHTVARILGVLAAGCFLVRFLR